MLAQQFCPIPADEPERIARVRSFDILDTPPEIEFDALTRVVAHAFNAPIAVIALMDSDRLWFKSRLGLDVPQLDRKIAFCAHAIMTPDAPLVIEDLAGDARFIINPLVSRAPHLRFYAGAPLVDDGGHALGTIAVIDTRPRPFNDAQRKILMDCSRLVMTALQGRRRALLLERLAMTDYLTGLPNRVQFDQAMATEMQHAQRSGKPFSLLCLDLDGFKGVNDQFGHAAGDEVLCEVARRLQRQLRLGDTAARLGGDEFAIVTRDADSAAVTTLAHRLTESVRLPIELSGGNRVTLGISVGIASYTSDVTSAQLLLARADKALYSIKNQLR
ncbi:sensor domain-containing diguanylate cyclase [Actimicrobium sp. CCC2.4]|uniref:sensor domain-containing diguanylate cyclase n=1 Tax=Actimicrobium sp. CCC2.4 TaxID=3048606 RepID=UPI002AC8ADD7|nr:sensor domain-containing diguanylate cyclase [Actimicrobium sp. CCC2.4]MEB0137292.1 sensor domain-containing diguanylate cyclase [Actimicrobium sp. CCC2.4]WPX32526.1 sensor domain-containing diguanylate cyclase [Actimicrobium sp. CCC2.4]